MEMEIEMEMDVMEIAICNERFIITETHIL